MRGARALFLATLACACGSPAPPAGVQWDSAATQAARAQIEATMHAFAAMDRAGFEAELAEDVVGFEIDLDGKPVRLGSRAEAVQFAEAIFAQLGSMGARMQLDIHAHDCHATSTLGYSTVEFDLTATLPDGSTMKQPSRNTVVLRKGEDGWKWTHWHSSLAVAAVAAP